MKNFSVKLILNLQYSQTYFCVFSGNENYLWNVNRSLIEKEGLNFCRIGAETVFTNGNIINSCFLLNLLFFYKGFQF